MRNGLGLRLLLLLGGLLGGGAQGFDELHDLRCGLLPCARVGFLGGLGVGGGVLGGQLQALGRDRLVHGQTALNETHQALQVGQVVVGRAHLGGEAQQHDGDFLRLVFHLHGLLTA